MKRNMSDQSDHVTQEAEVLCTRHEALVLVKHWLRRLLELDDVDSTTDVDHLDFRTESYVTRRIGALIASRLITAGEVDRLKDELYEALANAESA